MLHTGSVSGDYHCSSVFKQHYLEINIRIDTSPDISKHPGMDLVTFFCRSLGTEIYIDFYFGYVCTDIVELNMSVPRRLGWEACPCHIHTGEVPAFFGAQ